MNSMMTPHVLNTILGTPQNRIQIVNWRQHGDDESYCRLEPFGADEPEGDIELSIRAELEVPEGDYDPEEHEDFDKVYYVNDDITVCDGEIIKRQDGRSFRVNITEVTGL